MCVPGNRFVGALLWSLPFGALFGVASWATADSAPWDARKDGAWTAMVELKDETKTFLGGAGHLRPLRPDGGWWVTPIHATLLTDGNVLINGWSRAKEISCEDRPGFVHDGRQNGTSFILDPNQIDHPNSNPLRVLPINEDPRPKAVTSELTPDVLYCSGHVPLADGRILFTGGAEYKNLDDNNNPVLAQKQDEFGLNYARLFDPRALGGKGKFTRVLETSPGGPHPTDEMKAQDNWSWYEPGMMWYPTNTKLSDGRVLVAGGFAKWADPFGKKFYNLSLTTFDETKLNAHQNPWSVILPHESAPQAMVLRTFDYIHSFLLPQEMVVGGHARQVAIMGGDNGAFAFLGLDPSLPVTDRVVTIADAKRPTSDGHPSLASDTTGALTATGRILVAGGGDRGLKEGQRIDLFDPQTGKWEKGLDTGITRIRAASVLLPDGTVLILNGEAMWNPEPSIGDRRQPTIFNPGPLTAQGPDHGSFRNLRAWPGDTNDRGYHNFALLLKDGRVMVGGGRTLLTDLDPATGKPVEQHRIGCERTDVRIFTPPYLTQGLERPVLRGLKEFSAWKIGGPAQDLRFEGPPLRKSAEGGIVLMALGSETHHFDMNQRYVRLDYEAQASGALVIKPPRARRPHDSTDHLIPPPPGDYVLFLISASGTPSEGKVVRLVL